MAGMKIRFTEKSTYGFYQRRNAMRCILLLTLLLAVPLHTLAADTPAAKPPLSAGVLSDIAASQEGGKLTVTMKTDRLLEPKTFRLDNPPRLVVDFQNTVNKVPFMKLPLNAPSAKQLRVSQFQSADPKIARVVFDLEQKSISQNITVEKAAVKITLQNEKPGTEKSSKTPQRTVAVAPASNSEKAASSEKPVPVKKSESNKATAETPVKSPEPIQKTVSSVSEKAPSSGKPVSDKKPESNKATAETPVKSPESIQKTASSATVSGSKNADPAKAPSVKKEEKAESIKPAVPVRVSEKPEVAEKAEVKETKVKPVVSAGTIVPKPAESSETASPASEVKKAESSIQRPEPGKTPALIASLDSGSVPVSRKVVQEIDVTPKPVKNAQASRFSGQLLTLDFVDLPLVDFFRVMSEEAGINIVLDPKVKGKISIKVEKLPWDQIFDMVLVNYNLDKQIEGNLIRIAHKSTIREEANEREALKKAMLLAADLETRVKRLNYAKADTLMDSLKDMKTVRGIVVHDERTNSLVLTDIPSSLDKMMQLITSLDIPQPQVEIEARIVSAVRDFAREIGVQFGFVKGNLERVTVGGPNTFGTIGGTRPSQTPSSAYVAGNPDTGRGASSSEAGESGSVSTGDAGNYNVNLPATKAFGGLGLSIGNIFDTFLLDAAITAGESKGLAKLISQPKVTAHNNTEAIIRQGTRFPVLVRANNTTTVQFYNAALTLTVVPQITYEGNVVLDLRVENNTADWSRTVESVPSIRISESESRVLVSDGGTTVIGGILIDEESNADDKVPGLGDLPLVGNLFKRTAKAHSTQEILFFVTPRVIN